MKKMFSQMIKAIFAPTKRLMLVLSLLLTISAVYASPGSKTYYAKATVAVAGESTGVGLVYVIDKDGKRFPNSGGLESTGTGDMSQENESNFSIKIGAIATDPNYCVKEWKKDGTTVITATGQEMPQSFWNKQGRGTEKCIAPKRNRKKANPTLRERRTCFLSAGICLHLYQRLTIAVTEAAGEDGNQIINGAEQTQTAGEEVKHTGAHLAYVHSVETGKTDKTEETKDQSHRFALAQSAYGSKAHGSGVLVGVGIGVGDVDGGLAVVCGLLGIINHVANIVLAVHFALDLDQTVLAEGLTAIDAHTLCINFGMFRAFHWMYLVS